MRTLIRLFLPLLLLLPLSAEALKKFEDVVLDTAGNAIQGATVAVTAYPSGTSVTIYSDDGTTTVTNSTVTTARDGTFSFYAPPGRYNFTVTSRGTIVDQVTDVQIDVGANGTTPSIATITALKALTGMVDGQIAEVACYYTCTTPDGGGGTFRYDAASTDTANDGTIVDPDASGAGRWERIYSGSLNVKWFGAKGDSTTDDSTYIKAALDVGVASGIAVYLPSGIFRVTYNVLDFTFAGAAGSFVFYGDGSTSILKMLDGVMTASNRRLLHLRPSVDMERIELRGIVFDNNARASAAPPGDYDYQQSHTIRLAPATGTTIKLVRYDNVVIKDPVADGMNNQDVGTIRDFIISNSSEIDRTRTRSSIQMSKIPENLVITNFTGFAIETENTTTLTARKSMQISNARVQLLDIQMGAAAAENKYGDLWIDNVVVDGVDVVFGRENQAIFNYTTVHASNSRLPVPSDGRWNALGLGSSFVNCEILIPYNAATGALTPLDMRPISVDTGVTLDRVRFMIDYEGTLPVAATGYLVAGLEAYAVGAAYRAEFTISNSYFDPRTEASVSTSRNGTYVLRDNVYGGTGYAINIGTTAGQFSDVTIDGGDFRAVTGEGIRASWLSADQVTTISRARLTGVHHGDAAAKIVTVSGTMTNADNWFYNDRTVLVSSLPTDGLRGDRVKLGTVAYGTTNDYTCTVPSATGTAVYRPRTNVVTLSKTTTGVGNVGGGTDDLVSYALPANTLNADGFGIRITAWGTTANNSNPKTVTLAFGATTIVTQALTVSEAGRWRMVAEVIRTGSGAQDWDSVLLASPTAIVKNGVGTAAITDTAAITIKGTATVTDGGGGINNDDVVQEGMIVEFLP